MVQQIGFITHSTRTLGDDVQSLAAAQFLSGIDHYIDRDRAAAFLPKDKTRIIISGWFRNALFQKKSWRHLELLFVSYSIAPDSVSILASKEMAAFYRRFEPIGCRDMFTVEVLKNIGVEAYFSGCLTLTMRNPYSARNNKVLLVDPFHELSAEAKNFARDVLLKDQINCLAGLDIQGASFFLKDNIPIEERFLHAGNILRMCAQAKMVITSRIHCALPCLALGTPVLFLCSDPQSPRYKGLIELMPHCSYHDFVRQRYSIPWDKSPVAPEEVARLAAGLSQRCNRFMRPLPWRKRKIAVPGLFRTLPNANNMISKTPVIVPSVNATQQDIIDTKKELWQKISLLDQRMDWLAWRASGYPFYLDEAKAEAVTVVMGVKNNAGPKIESALKALRNQTYPKKLYSIMIVDYDGSADMSALLKRLCSKYLAAYVRVDRKPEWNRAACLNIGIRRVTTKYILLSDPYLILDKNYIQVAVKALATDPWQVAYCPLSPTPNAASDPAASSLKGLAYCCGRTALFYQMGGLDEKYALDGDRDSGLRQRFNKIGVRLRDLSSKTSHRYVTEEPPEALDAQTLLLRQANNRNHYTKPSPIILNAGPWSMADTGV